MREIDFHGARLAARAAERTRKRKMFPILQATQMRRDDRADGAGISRAVGVAAHVAENWADIQARAATDAMQRIALLGVRQQLRAAVIEQHHVIFLGAIEFARLTRTA